MGALAVAAFIWDSSRAISCNLTIETLFAAFACLWHQGSISAGPHVIIWFSYMVVILVAQQRGWSKLHDYQQALQAAQDASETLFAIFCDAKFWVATDASTIITKDPRLDSMMGAAMLGEQLQQHLSAEDQQRLRSTVTQLEASGAPTHAVLLPLSLQPRVGSPVDVDLFIVDRRKHGGRRSSSRGDGCGFRADDNDSEIGLSAAMPGVECPRRGLSPGFLVGLRLVRTAEPDVPVVSPSALDMAAVAAESLREDAVTDFRAPSQDVSSGAMHAAQSRGMRSEVTEVSVSWTLPSGDRTPAEVSTCSRAELEGAILAGKWAGLPMPLSSAQEKATVLTAIHLVCERARGGAFLCIGRKRSFDQVFKSNAQGQAGTVPSLTTCDCGYMTNLLKRIHISDERFAAAFAAFTECSTSDVWPRDHPDASARGRPKNGALLLSTSGYRLLCAAKISGLVAPRSWRGGGTKHEVAMACAWSVPGCFVLVRSAAGPIHAMFSCDNALQVVQLALGR
eukprot:CAMPEP_0115383748 /NCGR_PEP_ID=MMETSP0271-20121206/6754_1 /TAXON_ID=71861 /ORGANISM="Scrippsiella trochoidea, Strain CCMP3099" /LENGTH=508 /DNA_ID=CAMNT_0002807085 /DNA_START=409 /DNA_END=1936 /DNA_ORIENTATION=-